MSSEEEIKGVILREKEKRLSINRVPKKTKELFLKLAKEEFEEDFGMCLKWLLEQALEYQDMKVSFFENISMKLDLLLNQSHSQPEEPQFITKRMLNGREIKIRKKEVPNK